MRALSCSYINYQIWNRAKKSLPSIEKLILFSLLLVDRFSAFFDIYLRVFSAKIPNHSKITRKHVLDSLISWRRRRRNKYFKHACRGTHHSDLVFYFKTIPNGPLLYPVQFYRNLDRFQDLGDSEEKLLGNFGGNLCD